MDKILGCQWVAVRPSHSLVQEKRPGRPIVRGLPSLGAGGFEAGSRFVDRDKSLDECAELVVEDSEFGLAPRIEGGLHHLLYVGRIGRFTLRGSRFYSGFEGHLVKSRARESRIAYNLIYDGEDGEASYEIDLPNGGLACVRGNLLGKSARAQNLALLAYGAEGNAHPQSRLRFEGNHAFSDNAQPVYFVRHWPERLPGDATLGLRDNVFVGAAQPGSWGRREDGNRLLPDEAREQALREQALREQALQVPPCAGACREESQPPAGEAAASSPGSSASTP